MNNFHPDDIENIEMQPSNASEGTSQDNHSSNLQQTGSYIFTCFVVWTVVILEVHVLSKLCKNNKPRNLFI